MSTKPPGPQRQRFQSHMAHGFIELVRGQIHKRCSEFPTHVYHPRQAELQLEEAARQVIVECLIAEFPEAWSVPQVTKDWPTANCIIDATRTSARMRVSWSPETDALQGGTPVDAIDFPVKQAPPSLAKRFFAGILNAIPGKRVADPDLAPVGKPEEALRQASRVANGTAAPSPSGKRAEPQKPQPNQASKPRPESSRKASR